MSDALVMDNIGLVHMYARPFRHRPDYDDIVSAGIVGLVKCVARYDGSTAIGTYAIHWIKNSILKYINRDAPAVRGVLNNLGADRPSCITLNQTANEDGTAGLIDFVEDSSNHMLPMYDRDLTNAIVAIITKASELPTKQRDAVLAAISGRKQSASQRMQMLEFRRRKSKTKTLIRKVLHHDA